MEGVAYGRWSAEEDPGQAEKLRPSHRHIEALAIDAVHQDGLESFWMYLGRGFVIALAGGVAGCPVNPDEVVKGGGRQADSRPVGHS